jgi:hypothetical protein
MASRFGLFVVGVAIIIVLLVVFGALDMGVGQEIVAPVGPTAPSVVPPSPWRPIWDALISGVALMLTVCIPLLTAVLIQWIRARTGVSEAQQQQILGPKLEAVFERAKAWADIKIKEAGIVSTPEERAKLMAEYVKAQNPDLVRAANASDAQLYEGALARQGATPSTPAPKPAMPVPGALR